MCYENGIVAIAGGSPMMLQEPVGMGHRCMKWWLRVTGGLPS